MIISEAQKKLIVDSIEQLFGITQAKLLGEHFSGNKIFFTVAQNTPFEETIAGLYTSALKAQHPEAMVDDSTIKSLATITSNYIDAQKLKTVNQTMMDILGAKTEKEVYQKVVENVEKASQYMDMLISTETQIVRAFANQEGIAQVAASVGDFDPYICFRGKIDNKLCKWCRAMYHTQNNIRIPKVFRLSELKEGYFKPKEWDGFSPYKAGHPRCRHSMTYISKNSGFDDNGNLVFKYIGYDILAEQRGLEKTELPFTQTTIGEIEDYFQVGFDHDHHCDDHCSH